MTGVDFDTLANRQSELIRKMIDGSVFLAPHSADAITSLTDTDKLLKTLPAGYGDIGMLNNDGVAFARSVDTSEVKSFGHIEPTRTDIKADTTTIKFSAQETKRDTIGLYTGADMTAITPDATSGEVAIPKPSRPTAKYYRALALGVDLTDAGELYVARFLPRARVTDYDDQSFKSDEDEALLFGVTLTGFIDSVLGYSELWLFGGEGWYAQLSEMGF